MNALHVTGVLHRRQGIDIVFAALFPSCLGDLLRDQFGHRTERH